MSTPTPHETLLAKIETDFDAIIARARAFLDGLIEHKAATVAAVKAAAPPAVPPPGSTGAPASTSATTATPASTAPSAGTPGA